MFLGAIGLALAERQRLGYQQRLALEPLARHGGFQALVGDALMGGMHVHQHQADGILGEDIHPLELRQSIAERRISPWFGR